MVTVSINIDVLSEMYAFDCDNADRIVVNAKNINHSRLYFKDKTVDWIRTGENSRIRLVNGANPIYYIFE